MSKRTLLCMFLLCLGTVAQAAPREACPTLDACVAELRALPPAPNMTTDAQSLIARMRQFDGAFDRFIALLADPDRQLAARAAYAVSQYESIDARYLPQVEAGIERDLGWLTRALGSISSDAALRRSVQLLLDIDFPPPGGESDAVLRAGARAVPFLVDGARCAKTCGMFAGRGLAYVFEHLGDAAASAAPALIAIAEDPKQPDATAEVAIEALSDLGGRALAMESRLVALRKSRPAVVYEINAALVAIDARETIAIFTARLDDPREDMEYVLSDIAGAGAAARDLGPRLAAMLAHDDPVVRRRAVDAIASIGYTDATPALIALLDDPRDVKMNWTAANALGRLHDARAIAALEHTASTHWYPDVRTMANKALVAIRTSKPIQEDDLDIFSDEDALGFDLRCAVSEVRVQEPGSREKLRSERDDAALKKLKYLSTIVDYGAGEGTAPVDGVSRITAGNMVRTENLVQHVPSVALRVDGGWLVGGDRGEFGGELVFIGDDGRRQTISDGNIQGLGRIGDRIVAAGGIAHLILNKGSLYEVQRDANGRWQSTFWRGLPGAPVDLLAVDRQTAFVRTESGDVLIDANGAMRMAPCAKQAK